jgi:nucleotide-binding universal stress UspA family protein
MRELELLPIGIDLKGRQINLQIRQGHPDTVITQKAGERQADLVVLGTTGRSGLPYLLLGSVAEKVLHMVPCDALVVKPQGFRFELPELLQIISPGF